MTPAPDARPVRALRIGITGPIGCGKSQVMRWLADLGAAAIDADAVAREVTAPGQPGHDAVVAHFGPAVAAPDGTLDRQALARLVFGDPAQLRDLEAIVHPLVRARILAALDAADRDGSPAIAVEAIKLVEGGSRRSATRPGSWPAIPWRSASGSRPGGRAHPTPSSGSRPRRGSWIGFGPS
ncbi:MAG: dephospho-CoA kinase [Chloroflexota bacterium]